MNFLDWIILALILLSAVVGLFRGIILEMLKLINLVVAIFITYYGKGYIDFIFNFIQHPQIKSVVTSVLTFIFMFILGNVVIFLLDKMISTAGAGKFFDKLFGVSYGIMRGLGCAILLVLILEKNPNIISQKWWIDSKGSIAAKKVFVMLHNKLPKTWQKQLNQWNSYGC